jgi:hypothetical protein
MNSEASSLPPVIGFEEVPACTPSLARQALTAAWKTIVFFWKYAVGALFCLSIAGAIMIVGWTYRLAQRCALRYWWARSHQRNSGERVGHHFARHDPAHEHVHWPNWFAHQNFRRTIRRQEGSSTLAYLWQFLKTPFHSLGLNLKIGIQGIFNTWVLTMPACVLWLFAWYDGWNNSFNKGYEQAPIGPLTGILGIVLFIAAMLYVPLAQARHAVTGEWRSFYNFSFVWGLVRRHWLACLFLAALSSLFFVPVMILKTAPTFIGQQPQYADMTNPQLLQALNRYFFAAALLIFPLYVYLRVLAARIYARGILRGIQTGEITVADLAPKERVELQRLNLIQVNPPRSRHVLLRVATSTTSLAFFVGGLFVTGLLWFSFVAQIYISEFFMYHQALAWVNQPLVQLPWFRYIPPHVQNPAPEFLFTALLLVLIFGSYALAKRLLAFVRQHRRAAA